MVQTTLQKHAKNKTKQQKQTEKTKQNKTQNKKQQLQYYNDLNTPHLQ